MSEYTDYEKFLARLGGAPYPRRFRWPERALHELACFLFGVDDSDNPEAPNGMMPLRRLFGWETSRLMERVCHVFERRGQRWLNEHACLGVNRPMSSEREALVARIAQKNREYYAQPVRLRMKKAKRARRVLREMKKVVG